MALDASLVALIAEARAALPQLSAVSDEDLAAHLARGKGPLPAPARGPDLLLALACARGVPVAIEAFEARVIRSDRLSAAVARVDASPGFADELRQVLRDKLLVPKGGRLPLIAEYAGRGPLLSWVLVVAMRAALLLRPATAERPAPPEAAGERDPELRLLQQKYGKDFEEALAASFSSLSDEQCNLLRLQIVDGLQTARIAALFRVDRSTIKRRLTACRETLLGETRRILAERLKLSPQSFESLARLVQSQLHVSVARLLRARSPG